MSTRKNSFDRWADEWSGIVTTQCVLCKHRSRGPLQVCAAFPAAIPDEILRNRVDHRKPYLVDGEPADVGIEGNTSITFAPRPDADPGALANLYRVLDRLTS